MSNIDVNLCDLGLGNGFLAKTPKAHTQGTIGKLDFIKILKLCTSQDTIKKIERQVIKWEKIFANHIPEKGLVSRLYKERS